MSSNNSSRSELPNSMDESMDADQHGRLKIYLQAHQDVKLEIEQIERIANLVNKQRQYEPPSRVLRELQTRIQTERSTNEPFRFRRLAWIWIVLLTVSVFLIVWGIAQPAMVMYWTVEYGEFEVFRVYRASSENSKFEMIAQVEVQAGSHEYSYSDVVVPTGREYIYQIEGINKTGEVGFSEIVLGSAVELIPVWLILAAVSLVSGLSLTFLIQRTVIRVPSGMQAVL